MTKEYLCQFDTHSPSARELAARPVEVFALKAQTDNRSVHLSHKTRFVFAVENSHHFLAKGTLVREQHHLRQITDGQVGILRNRTCSRLILTGNKAE